MNYQKIYDDICKRGQERILPADVYTEKHHIIPKCMEGTNEKSNLTVLTAREHFICHWILAEKLYPNNPKLWFAFWGICNQKNTHQIRYIPSSRTYENAKLRAKILIGISNTGRIISEETRLKLYITSTDRTHTVESKNKLSECNSGNKHPRFGKECSPEEKEKNRLGNIGKIISVEQKNAISNALTGIKRSDEFKQKIRDSWILRKLPGYVPKTQKKKKVELFMYEVNGEKFHNAVELAKYFNISRDAARCRCYSKNIQWTNWKVIHEEQEIDTNNLD